MKFYDSYAEFSLSSMKISLIFYWALWKFPDSNPDVGGGGGAGNQRIIINSFNIKILSRSGLFSNFTLFCSQSWRFLKQETKQRVALLVSAPTNDLEFY